MLKHILFLSLDILDHRTAIHKQKDFKFLPIATRGIAIATVWESTRISCSGTAEAPVFNGF